MMWELMVLVLSVEIAGGMQQPYPFLIIHIKFDDAPDGTDDIQWSVRLNVLT